MNFSDALLPCSSLMFYLWLPPLAVWLDRALGDPSSWPHPVRAIGALLGFVEPRARRLPVSERAAGTAAVIAVLAATWVSVRLLLLFPFTFTLVFAAYLSFAGLALGQLVREGKAALALLEQNSVDDARSAIGMLVSRDISGVDRDELCRVLAETMAENLNDAFIAPFFWLVTGGPAALWLYKASSTMDSMWGYPYEPWTRFGTAAARLDDVMAYVPARLTALFVYGGAVFTNGRKAPASWPGFPRVAADAKTMKSPNAGWPMAACAWVHGAAMGGRAVYAGTIVEKPVLGLPGTGWTTEKLRSLLTGMTVAAHGGAAFLWVTVGILRFIVF